MVAGNPYPLTALHERAEGLEIAGGHAFARARIVKRIPKRDNQFGRVTQDQRGKPGQSRGCVIGRQELAARRVGRAFFKMQIGNNERSRSFMPERTGRISEQMLARNSASLTRLPRPDRVTPRRVKVVDRRSLR